MLGVNVTPRKVGGTHALISRRTSQISIKEGSARDVGAHELPVTDEALLEAHTLPEKKPYTDPEHLTCPDGGLHERVKLDKDSPRGLCWRSQHFQC